MAEHVTKIFISATSEDLRTVRLMVRDALLNMGCLPVVQEHFSPDYRDVSGKLRSEIEKCDAIIHIAGMRYGAEPDPACLPEGVPRRSYTQMEVDLARELKLEKIFTFVCPEDFPYDSVDPNGDALVDEPEELQALQRAHRERLLSQESLRYRVGTPEELANQVREIQVELEQVKNLARQNRRRMLWIGGAIAVALTLLAVGIGWVMQQQGNQGEAIGEVAVDVREVRETLAKNPEIVATQLKNFVQDKAEAEIAKHEGD